MCSLTIECVLLRLSLCVSLCFLYKCPAQYILSMHICHIIIHICHIIIHICHTRIAAPEVQLCVYDIYVQSLCFLYKCPAQYILSMHTKPWTEKQKTSQRSVTFENVSQTETPYKGTPPGILFPENQGWTFWNDLLQVLEKNTWHVFSFFFFLEKKRTHDTPPPGTWEKHMTRKEWQNILSWPIFVVCSGMCVSVCIHARTRNEWKGLEGRWRLIFFFFFPSWICQAQLRAGRPLSEGAHIRETERETEIERERER